MRPLAIDVQGFTAFRDLQQVDLSKLDLFVITGPTGSGKTSLLDAMIFALYGRVPRAGRHGMKELISHGIAEARVKLEFSVDGQRYRITRRLPRKQAQSATLERAEGDDWRSAVEGSGIRAVDSCVVELLKLPYEAFTRAVVLPQGQFQEFLRGEREDRRKILTDLLGVKHYLEMGQRARARAKELETTIEATEKILAEQYADVSEAAKKDLDGQAADAERRAADLGEALTKAEEIDGERKALLSAVEGLAEKSEQIAAVDEELGQEKTDFAEAQEEQMRLLQQREQAQAAWQQATDEAKTGDDRLAAARKKHGTLEDLTRLEQAVEAAAEAEQERVGEAAKLEQLRSELGELASAAATAAAEDQRTRSLLTEAEKSEQTARAEAETARAENEAVIGRLRESEQAREQQQRALDEAAKAAKALSAAEKKVEPAAGKLAKAESTLAEVGHRHRVAVIAADLNPGEPCPICRRPLDEHPSIDGVAATVLEEAKEKLASARKTLESVSGTLAMAKERDRASSEQATLAEERLREALGESETFETLRAQASAVGARAEETATAAAAASASLTKSRNQHQATAAAALEKKATAERHEVRITEVNSATEKATRRRDTANKALTTHLGTKKVPQNVDERLAAGRQSVENAEAAAAKAREHVDEAREFRDSLAEELSDVDRQLSAADQQIAGLRARCDALSTQVVRELDSINADAAVPALEAQPATRDEYVDQLHGWCRQVGAVITKGCRVANGAEVKLERQIDRLLDKYGIEAEHDVNGTVAIRQANEAAVDARGTLREQAKQMAKRLSQRQDLEERTITQREEAQILAALSAELRANRFVGFLLQETLDLLALWASDELRRISDERYSLVSEEGDFAVIDHANADERRSVNTLSGGETFLASLALALALSRHVGDLATEGMGAKLQAVFIDEGFGTLDDETLEDVIDALERLQEGELMVGVITHVPALAERIKVGLEIDKHQGRSTVRIADAA